MGARIVVVGAGFGGLTAARRLAKAAGGRDLEIVIVDRHNYHTFQPLLYQVATAGLQPQDIGRSVRTMFGLRGRRPRARVSFRMGEVGGLDTDAHDVILEGGDRLAYDHVVLAAGATTADYGIPGVEEHAFPLKSIEEALALRNHLLSSFERADAGGHHADPGELTFVVAGGGPTGVELAGAMAELVDGPLRRDHPDLDVGRVRIVLVEMMDAVLPPYAASSRRYARRQLEARGVEVRLGTAIERVEPDRVVLDDGTAVATRTLVWTAGVRAAPLADRLGLDQTDGGRVVVAADLSVPGADGVWVVGDMAAARDPDGALHPQLAPVAMQQGRHVATQLLRRMDGRTTEGFAYRDKGTMATIGRNAAVAELPGGLRIRGLPAWLAWLFLHLYYLIGFRNRVAVFLSWIYNYLTYDRSARLILGSVGDEDETVPTDVGGRRPA